MKYRDLSAVEQVTLEEMKKVVGGFSLEPLDHAGAIQGLGTAIPAAATGLTQVVTSGAAARIPPDQVATFVAVIEAVT